MPVPASGIIFHPNSRSIPHPKNTCQSSLIDVDFDRTHALVRAVSTVYVYWDAGTIIIAAWARPRRPALERHPWELNTGPTVIDVGNTINLCWGLFIFGFATLH
jgi:hypothetical protein